jgi:hypothetical protein
MQTNVLSNPFPPRRQGRSHAVHQAVEPPSVGDALQLVLPGVLKSQTAPTHEGYHGPRHEDLRRPGLSRKPRADDDHRYPSDPLSNRLHLTGVHAGLSSSPRRRTASIAAFAQRTALAGSVEGRKEAITGSIHFGALVAV